MLTKRLSSERGTGDHGWLHSRHSFSFAEYFDPAHMGFRGLRVINEDLIKGGNGFGMHGHRNMEIISYLVKGRLAHRDSAGHEAAIGPGEVQYMSAGSGIRHSEFNASETDIAHLLQIWIEPNELGADPAYQDRDFTEALESGELTLLASPDGREGSIAIRADALVHAAQAKAGKTFVYKLGNGRGAWVQLIKGDLDVNGVKLAEGDALAAEDEAELTLHTGGGAEFLLFDLG